MKSSTCEVWSKHFGRNSLSKMLMKTGTEGSVIERMEAFLSLLLHSTELRRVVSCSAYWQLCDFHWVVSAFLFPYALARKNGQHLSCCSSREASISSRHGGRGSHHEQVNPVPEPRANYRRPRTHTARRRSYIVFCLLEGLFFLSDISIKTLMASSGGKCFLRCSKCSANRSCLRVRYSCFAVGVKPVKTYCADWYSARICCRILATSDWWSMVMSPCGSNRCVNEAENNPPPKIIWLLWGCVKLHENIPTYYFHTDEIQWWLWSD